jgi:hypothetical protein
MDQVCYVLPIRRGKTEAARELVHTIREDRLEEYERSQRRHSITKEVWFLATGLGGDQFVVYLEAADFAATLAAYTASDDPFDAWFNGRRQELTGFAAGDAEVQAEAPLPERLLMFEA